ncbi:MAG: molybdate ABC transporter substrate-binding protein [Cyanobacteria bacterium]|nr:molybdate ABC transporter substrate-binding protein [Cyanobacteria bacterium CG_2015-16_32_12]NCO76979.1 molybdate ABC transporter substrate-binding protein [Cyanobacteria bacterium CG_2015-22_32_23]NCQ04767.1 molybdate ABC transporter substrate-binding protein [Cyanobacteria bacterium CG_2015-09_32_10]NCQ42966.1 molybdate ABC transporter substrate-binding protein [Cyanobacteria bacterium CG_2015-04_32_10]NCS85063.1 molybdate ABC transporter substrate-binding protein [Cyanobacteria bacterium
MFLKRAIYFFLVLLGIIYFSFIIRGNNNPQILIGAAASLQPALEEFSKKYPQNVDYNFASSGILQQQIEQGAPIDVFISASFKQMDNLEKNNLLLPNTRKNLLLNQIALITPKNNPLSLTNFPQLVQPKITLIAIGEARSVPAGQYALEVFKNLGILASLESKFVYGNNVRETLTYVETGNVDAGIVYLTDAKSSDKVKVIAIADKQLHTPIIYPVAVIKNSKSQQIAKKYLESLQSETARKIFQKYGFGIAK